MKVNSYVNFPGNTEEAFNFYKSVFGGEFSAVVKFKDMPMEGVNIPKEAENKILHIGLPIGKDNVLMATDALESLGQKLTQGNNVYISVHPENKEEADRIFNALSASGTIEMPITDDGGKTWKTITRGLHSLYIPNPTAEVGHCVHRIAMHPSRPNVLFMQKHWDVMRSND